MIPKCFGRRALLGAQDQAEYGCDDCGWRSGCATFSEPHCELIEEKIVFIVLPRRVRGLGVPCLTMLKHVLRRTYIDWDGSKWSEHYFIGHAP